MKLLLDTHIFIWWADQPEKTFTRRTFCFKLKLSLPLKELLKNQQETNDLTVSPVTLTHVLALDALPFHHKDPFDRLLIAQSIEEQLTIVTADSQFSAYSVKWLQ
jgi:PIN domain nuclease of toxin-antitoxin system